MDEGGGPAGVNEPADEGGGPAGVVERFEAPNENCLAPSLFLLSGVAGGGLDENGTWKPDILSMANCHSGIETISDHHSNPRVAPCGKSRSCSTGGFRIYENH